MSKKHSKLTEETTPVVAPQPQFQTLPFPTARTAQQSTPAVAEPTGSEIVEADPTIDVLSRVLGTRNKELIRHRLQQACNTSPGPKDEGFAEQFRRVEPALRGIGPRDEIEGMLAVQMAGLHNVAMDHLRRAALAEQDGDRRDKSVNNASKLLRAFAQATEALNRYRGKGQQKVTVEHVHVHAGGQAIVGSVESGSGKGERDEQ